MHRHHAENLAQADALLFGQMTYEMMDAGRRPLAELGLIDDDEFVAQPRLAGHGPRLFAELSKHVDLRLVSRLEFGSKAVAMRYAPRK